MYPSGMIKIKLRLVAERLDDRRDEGYRPIICGSNGALEKWVSVRNPNIPFEQSAYSD